MEIIAKTENGVIINATNDEVNEILNAVSGAKPEKLKIGMKIPAIDYASTIRKVQGLGKELIAPLAADRAEFEAARLEERKKQDALQAKLDEERMIRQKEDAVKAAKDAEELRLQREEIDPDIKIHGFRQANKAEGNRITFEKYCAMWDEAVRLNMAIVNDSALEENAAFDHKSAEDEKIRKEAPMKSAAQNKLIKSDQKKIQTEINKIDTMISEIKPLDYATDEAAQVVADMYVKIKTALDDAEKAGCNLE